MSYRILVVDDEADILEFVGYNLEKEGYEVYTASNGTEAVKKALEALPHLVLLDIMMPEMNGMEACAKMREYPQLTPTLIVFLSARGEEDMQLAGYDAGGDDYITKPIRVKVLMSRVKAILKRMEEDPLNMEGRAIKIDRDRYVVVKDDVEMILPRKEFNLLTLLYSQPGKVFLREEIYNAVWGSDVIVGDRTIDVHVRKLREKIGEDHIKTVKGVGYSYED